ncbi:hypothetical protein BHM03_00010194 [Ensete ventricosum]|nr:hypothetical protein BHM03_00010194 [Ensete ventricosum]
MSGTRIFGSLKEKQRSRLRTWPNAVGTCCYLTARRKLTSRGGMPHEAKEAEGEGRDCGHGVGHVSLLVGADAIVVVHEEDDLMHKDTSVDE